MSSDPIQDARNKAHLMKRMSSQLPATCPNNCTDGKVWYEKKPGVMWLKLCPDEFHKAYSGATGVLGLPEAEQIAIYEEAANRAGDKMNAVLAQAQPQESELEAIELIERVAILYYELGRQGTPWSGKPGAAYPAQITTLLEAAKAQGMAETAAKFNATSYVEAAKREGAREAERQHIRFMATLLRSVGGQIEITRAAMTTVEDTDAVESWIDPATGNKVYRLAALRG